MNGLYSHALNEVFGGFIRGAPEVLRAIHAFADEVRIVDSSLTFTIPALFTFVRVSYEARGGAPTGADAAAYLRFRKSLYGNNTNQRLKAWGGHVEIVSSHADHNLNVYRLVRNGCGG